MSTLFRSSKRIFLIAIFFSFSLAVLGQTGAQLYQQNCAQCHGSDLDGGNAASLIDGIWQFGAENGYIFRNIKFGIAHLGMPSYEKTLNDSEIGALVEYIRESEKNVGAERPPIVDNSETLDYDLNVEVFADGLEIPWAIDFTDKNTALITERPGRLRVVKMGCCRKSL